MNYSVILKWSEVWAVIIPILIYLYKKPNEKYIKPVIWYLVIALILNIICDIIGENYYNEPKFIVAINYNLPFYNLHSIIRLFLFINFFHFINVPANKFIKKILPIVIAALVVFNFLFLDSFKNFSSKIFTIESIVLIVYCIIYFLAILGADDASNNFNSSLIIVTGLAVYESVCFPIFLFYDLLSKKFQDYAIDIWDVHNIMYIILCLFIARAFYGRIKI